VSDTELWTCISSLTTSAGAKIDGVDVFEMTPLHLAASHGNVEVIKLLIDNGVRLVGSMPEKDAVYGKKLHSLLFQQPLQAPMSMP
jgi:ankyrin repeat protein